VNTIDFGQIFLVLLGITLLCLLLITAGRVVRDVVDRSRAKRERRLRPQLLALLTTEADAPPVHLVLHRGDVDALADFAGPLLGKVRGEGRQRLADQLHQHGIVSQARKRLDSASAVRRARAAAFLGSVRDDESVDRLCLALQDRHLDVRSAAARALGHIGQPDAAPFLLRALGGEPGADDAVPAGTIVTSLLALGPAAAPAALDAAVGATATRQAMAVETLGLLGFVEGTDALIGLVTLDASAGMDVRIRSARALGRIGSPRAVPFLAAILQGDEPWPVRAIAAKALGDIGAAGAVDALWPLLGDPEASVVVNVARALATTPEGIARLADLAATAPTAGILTDADWALYQPAVAAAEALAAAGVPEEEAVAEPAVPIDLRAGDLARPAPAENADLTARSPSPAERAT
jgi:HEAT repeat protein